jgi:gamma-glutamylputrescine oxidase
VPKMGIRKMNIVNFSYWEQKQFLSQNDVIVIGSGIVGLSTAIFLKKKSPKLKVLIIERGVLPSGASTKNAGFACFGSPTEILDDLKQSSKDSVLSTIEMRWQGLELLRTTLSDKLIDYKPLGGFEIFSDKLAYENCLTELSFLNSFIKEAIGKPTTYQAKHEAISENGFKTIKGVIKNRYEGQLDTGKMMHSLLALAQSLGVQILNGIEVRSISDLISFVNVETTIGVLKTNKVVVATNGFAAQLLNTKLVQPARAQVLITKPISNLKLNGSFHFDKGYYYFRNIDNRILLGGGRNLDFKGETTTEMITTPVIQTALETLLKELIIPYSKVEVEMRWAGIMGVGHEKKPIIQAVSSNVIAAVRMGGMGVAIGSKVGQTVAKMII